MKQILGVFAMLLFSTAALAECPAATMEIYSGDPIGVFCYDNSSRVFWANVVRICLVEDGPTIAFEMGSEEGQERLVGVCRGTLETRP